MKLLSEAAVCWLFIAAAAAGEPLVPDPAKSEAAAKREQALVERVQGFELELIYYGPQDKPYYHLTLAVQPGERASQVPFHPTVPLDKSQALKIIAWLSGEGFFDKAIDDVSQDITLRTPAGPTYWLVVRGQSGELGRVQWHQDLGWNLEMIHRLESLQAVLGKQAAAALDMLLVRLSGHRKIWEQAVPANP